MDADATAVRSLCSNRDEQEHDKIVSNEQEHEKIIMKDAASAIAIFKDREKDLSDPDYNRSYDRYSPDIWLELMKVSSNISFVMKHKYLKVF